MSKTDVLSTSLTLRCQTVMYCLRFRIPGHEGISEAAIRILRNALMTATGGQIPAHESISEAAIRILRDALMSAKHVYDKMDQHHCAHESIAQDPDGSFADALMSRNLSPCCGHESIAQDLHRIFADGLMSTDFESQTVQHFLASETQTSRQYITF